VQLSDRNDGRVIVGAGVGVTCNENKLWIGERTEPRRECVRRHAVNVCRGENEPTSSLHSTHGLGHHELGVATVELACDRGCIHVLPRRVLVEQMWALFGVLQPLTVVAHQRVLERDDERLACNLVLEVHHGVSKVVALWRRRDHDHGSVLLRGERDDNLVKEIGWPEHDLIADDQLGALAAQRVKARLASEQSAHRETHTHTQHQQRWTERTRDIVVGSMGFSGQNVIWWDSVHSDHYKQTHPVDTVEPTVGH